MGSVRVLYHCVPFLLGKPGVKNPFPPKKCSDSPDCESQEFQCGFDPKNSLKVWILWIHDPFLDLPKKRTLS